MLYTQYDMTWSEICRRHGWDFYNDCPGYYRERGELSEEEDQELFEAWVCTDYDMADEG